MEFHSFKDYTKEHHMEPLVYFCGIDENLEPGVKCGPVQRDVFLIECCVSGYGGIEINGVKFPITPRSCYFLLPNKMVPSRTRLDPHSIAVSKSPDIPIDKTRTLLLSNFLACMSRNKSFIREK